MAVIFGCLGIVVHSIITAVKYDSSMTINSKVVQEQALGTSFIEICRRFFK
jgi:hypothetical protein